MLLNDQCSEACSVPLHMLLITPVFSPSAHAPQHPSVQSLSTCSSLPPCPNCGPCSAASVTIALCRHLLHCGAPAQFLQSTIFNLRFMLLAEAYHINALPYAACPQTPPIISGLPPGHVYAVSLRVFVRVFDLWVYFLRDFLTRRLPVVLTSMPVALVIMPVVLAIMSVRCACDHVCWACDHARCTCHHVCPLCLLLCLLCLLSCLSVVLVIVSVVLVIVSVRCACYYVCCACYRVCSLCLLLCPLCLLSCPPIVHVKPVHHGSLLTCLHLTSPHSRSGLPAATAPPPTHTHARARMPMKRCLPRLPTCNYTHPHS